MQMVQIAFALHHLHRGGASGANATPKGIACCTTATTLWLCTIVCTIDPCNEHGQLEVCGHASRRWPPNRQASGNTPPSILLI